MHHCSAVKPMHIIHIRIHSAEGSSDILTFPLELKKRKLAKTMQQKTGEVWPKCWRKKDDFQFQESLLSKRRTAWLWWFSCGLWRGSLSVWAEQKPALLCGQKRGRRGRSSVTKMFLIRSLLFVWRFGHAKMKRWTLLHPFWSSDCRNHYWQDFIVLNVHKTHIYIHALDRNFRRFPVSVE